MYYCCGWMLPTLVVSRPFVFDDFTAYRGHFVPLAFWSLRRFGWYHWVVHFFVFLVYYLPRSPFVVMNLFQLFALVSHLDATGVNTSAACRSASHARLTGHFNGVNIAARNILFVTRLLFWFTFASACHFCHNLLVDPSSQGWSGTRTTCRRSCQQSQWLAGTTSAGMYVPSTWSPTPSSLVGLATSQKEMRLIRVGNVNIPGGGGRYPDMWLFTMIERRRHISVCDRSG